MKNEEKGQDGKQGVSRVKVALGAAGLFLFIIGVKRSFHFGEVSVSEGARQRELEPEPSSGAEDEEDWE